MRIRSFAVMWAFVFAGSFALAWLCYALASAAVGSGLITWFLWPGVGLYTMFNGSLLFGGGFGRSGDFLLIVAGSALAWSLLIVLIIVVVARVRRPDSR